MSKTINIGKYIECKKFIFDNLKNILGHYDASYTSHNFLNYRVTHKIQQEVVNFFLGSSKKYTTLYQTKDEPTISLFILVIITIIKIIIITQ